MTERTTGEQRVFDDVMNHPRTTTVQIADRLHIGTDTVAHALRRDPDRYVRERFDPTRPTSSTNPHVYTVASPAARPTDGRGKRKLKR